MDGAELGIDGLAVVEMIGRGGFGAVYRVRDEVHGRDVAVKVLPALLDDSARRQFDRERRAMGALSDHPGIGTVHTSGFTANGEPYIAMQLMGGGSLADRIARGPLAVADALAIGASMADALAAAHAAGVLHLDIKPENILFTAHGEPKLVDFGIAKLADDTGATSTIRATPAYAAPEVLEGQTATPAADVYSLAVTIYAAIMGHAPFSGDSMLTVLRRIAVEPVPEITRPDVPPAIVGALRRAMDKMPTARPASMEQFADEIRQLSASFTTVATEQQPDADSPSSTVMFATGAPIAPTNPSGGFTAPPAAVSGPVPLFGSAPPGSVVTGQAPLGSDAPPPGAVPYVAPAKRPTGIIIGGVAAAVIALIAVVVIATRGGGEPTAGAATTAPVSAVAATNPTTTAPSTTAAPTTQASTTTAAPVTAAPAPVTTAPVVIAPPPTQPPAVFPVVTDVRWGNGLDGSNRALPTGSYFPDGTTEICISWTANNFDVGAPWRIAWSFDGVIDPALGGNGTIGSSIDPFFACVFNDAGVFPGLYEMTWHVNDQLTFVDSVYLGGGRPAAVVTMINGTGVEICRLNVSPSTADFWGRDVLDRATIPVDGAFDVTLAAGLYDVRAATCDGVDIAVNTSIDFQATAPYVIVASG